MVGEGLPMALIRWTLGALFIDSFFVNLHDHNYTQAGYARLIHHYISSASSPSVWQSVERFVADHAAVFSIAQAAGELGLGVALTVGLVRPIAAAGAAMLLFGLALSELGLHWIWEFPPIIVGACAVALATAPAFRSARTLGERLLGPRVLGPAGGFVAAVAGGVVLAVMISAHGDPTIEVWRSGLVFGLCLLASAVIDRRRVPGLSVAG